MIPSVSPHSLLLLGASRGAGLEVARLARSRGRPVFALTRSFSEPLERLGVVQLHGDALDPGRMAETCRLSAGAAAVVCTMGGGPVGASADFAGVVHAVEGAREAGIRRFLLVSSLGAGESRAYASERLLAAIGPVLEEKSRAEEFLAASGLDFTILRPGRLLDGPATGGGALSPDPAVHGGITRADLAALLLDCLEQPESVGRTFSAVDRADLERVN